MNLLRTGATRSVVRASAMRLVVAFAILLLTVSLPAGGAAAASKTKGLAGGWGCEGQALHTTGGGETRSMSQTLQFTADAAGNITANGVVNFSTGEVCQFPILPGSTYTLNSDGTGIIALKVGAGTAEGDGDFDCSAVFGSAATLSIGFVTTGAASQFFFTSNDDYNSAAANDSSGDFVPFSGQCTRQ